MVRLRGTAVRWTICARERAFVEKEERRCKRRTICAQSINTCKMNNASAAVDVPRCHHLTEGFPSMLEGEMGDNLELKRSAREVSLNALPSRERNYGTN